MNRNKLTRREAALIHHASRRAIRRHEESETIRLHLGKKVFVCVTLAQLRDINTLFQRPPTLDFYYAADSIIRLEGW